MPSPSSKTKILLLGTHGQYNWGDDLLLDTFLKELGPEHQYFINSYDPAGTSQSVKDRASATVFHTTKDRLALLRYIFKADAVVFAGGTLLRELYKTSGRNRYSSLLMVTALVVFAKKIARKKIIMGNIGMGPVKTRFGRLIAKIALRNADSVSFRDEQSFRLAKSLGPIRTAMKVVPDTIFARAEHDFLPADRQRQKRESGSLTIGLNLNYDIANPDNWNHFTAMLAEALRILSKMYVLTVRTIPMQVAFNPRNDVVTLREFQSMIPEIKFIETVPGRPEDIGTAIAECDIILAERFHMLVIASILGTPFVALEYDIKVASLVERLGMKPYSVDINRRFESWDIAGRAFQAIENSDKIAAELAATAKSYRDELNQHFTSIRNELV